MTSKPFNEHQFYQGICGRQFCEGYFKKYIFWQLTLGKYLGSDLIVIGMEDEQTSSWSFLQVQIHTKSRSKPHAKNPYDPRLIWGPWYFVSKIAPIFCEKNCCSDSEKLLKFEAEGWEFGNILRSLEEFIGMVKGQNNFWNRMHL